MNKWMPFSLILCYRYYSGFIYNGLLRIFCSFLLNLDGMFSLKFLQTPGRINFSKLSPWWRWWAGQLESQCCVLLCLPSCYLVYCCRLYFFVCFRPATSLQSKSGFTSGVSEAIYTENQRQSSWAVPAETYSCENCARGERFRWVTPNGVRWYWTLIAPLICAAYDLVLKVILLPVTLSFGYSGLNIISWVSDELIECRTTWQVIKFTFPDIM